MKKLIIMLAIFGLPWVSFATSPTVTITGKLIDRQCSVEDVFGYQPATDKRCTLWIETTFACPTGTCKAVYTVYCPRKATDNRFFTSSLRCL